jgi:protease IV
MRQFLKYTLASLTGTILFFGLLGSLLTLGAVGLVGILLAGLDQGGHASAVDPDTVLVYDLSTVIPDSPQMLDPGALLLGGAPPADLTLRQAVLALETAAQDDRIVALYLKGSDGEIGTGLANQIDVRGAIESFRAAGKPILAYDLSWSEREYALAALAETVYLNPFGELEMNGLYAETLYQAEALEKLGVGVQVTRVGQYKSAVEPLLRNTMSLEEREQTQGILGDVWQTLLAEIAGPRSLQPPQLQAIANTQGFLFGQEAATTGLVDAIAYEDEVIDALRDLTGEGDTVNGDFDFRQISLSHYANTVDDPRIDRRSSNEVALIYAEGPIVDGTSGDGFGGSIVIAGNTLAGQLRQLRQDDAVKAVVLRVNSPGGSATASEIILREVQLLRQAGKPVVVSMGDVAASGGYWIASQADAILAQPTSITGSIGVFGIFLNLENLGTKVGVNWDGVKTAQFADIFSISRPRTEAELAVLQRAVDTIYDAFLERVVEGRGLPPDRVAELAQGRVWSGKSAQKLGLVDKLGGLNPAIDTAAELAELGDDWRLVEYPKTGEWQRFWRIFWSTEARRIRATDPLTVQVLHFFDETHLIRSLNDPRGIYAVMPFRFVVK